MERVLECAKCKKVFEESRMLYVFDAEREGFLSKTDTLLIEASNLCTVRWGELQFKTLNGSLCDDEGLLRAKYQWIKPRCGCECYRKTAKCCFTYICEFCVNELLQTKEIVEEEPDIIDYYPCKCDACGTKFDCKHEKDKYGATLFSRDGEGCDVFVFFGEIFQDRREKFPDEKCMHYKLKKNKNVLLRDMNRICGTCFDRFKQIYGVAASAIGFESRIPEQRSYFLEWIMSLKNKERSVHLDDNVFVLPE